MRRREEDRLAVALLRLMEALGRFARPRGGNAQAKRAYAKAQALGKQAAKKKSGRPVAPRQTAQAKAGRAPRQAHVPIPGLERNGGARRQAAARLPQKKAAFLPYRIGKPVPGEACSALSFWRLGRIGDISMPRGGRNCAWLLGKTADLEKRGQRPTAAAALKAERRRRVWRWEGRASFCRGGSAPMAWSARCCQTPPV